MFEICSSQKYLKTNTFPLDYKNTKKKAPTVSFVRTLQSDETDNERVAQVGTV